MVGHALLPTDAQQFLEHFGLCPNGKLGICVANVSRPIVFCDVAAIWHPVCKSRIDSAWHGVRCGYIIKPRVEGP